jgi:hypothetical protein
MTSFARPPHLALAQRAQSRVRREHLDAVDAGVSPRAGLRPMTAVNSLAVRFPWLSLSGGHLLVDGVLVSLPVFDSV